MAQTVFALIQLQPMSTSNLSEDAAVSILLLPYFWRVHQVMSSWF